MLAWSETLAVILEALRESRRVKPASWAARRVLLRRGLAGKPVDRFVTGVVTGFARSRGIVEELCRRVYGRLCGEPGISELLQLHVYLSAVDSRMRSEAREELLKRIEEMLQARGVAAKRLPRWSGLPVAEWIVKELRRYWGAEAYEAIRSMLNGRRVHWLRVNTLRVRNPERLYDKLLDELGERAKPSKYVPYAFAIEGPLPPRIARLLDKGILVAQDESAAVAAMLLEPRPGELIIDACAAPGGKTSMLAALTGNAARIISVEVSPSRAMALKKRMRKLGVKAEIVAADARLLHKLLGENVADAILLDPPCTSTGVLDKSPDARWLPREALERLVDLQYELLDSALRVLKPGGRLLYSTCSLLPSENELLVYKLLEERGDIEEAITPKVYDPSPYMPSARRSWPHKHSTGGMFYSILVKKR